MVDELVMKPRKFMDNVPISHLDEGWWQSLLVEIENESEQLRSDEANVSPANAEGQIDWTIVERLYKADETVCAQVVAYNQGGVLVENDGLQGFVPLSHLIKLEKMDGHDAQAAVIEILRSYMGQVITLKVIEYEPERGRVVLSERAALAGSGCRDRLFTTLRSGDRVTGQVTTITNFGVFVDLGGVEGLIHVSELSWGRVQNPCDLLKVGEEVTAMVLRVDPTRCRIALSLKRLRDNPWETIEERYVIGQVIPATITALMPYGAFVHVEEGVDGLIHISEFKRAGRRIKQEQFVEGRVIYVRILSIDAAKQRLGLGLVMDD